MANHAERHLSARGWQVLNPAIYLISILPGVGVWQLSRPIGKAQVSLVLATLAVALLQHAINLLNDVSDWRLGADVEKWDSWIRFHEEDIKVAERHGWLSFLAGGVLGLAALAWNDRMWILLLALPLVSLGYLYNSGQRPLSYTRLAEWVTGLCYGPGVFGCLWLLTQQVLTLSAIYGSAAFGCLAVALLLSHQPPQIHTDRQAGKRSFAVRYGAARAYRWVRFLFLGFLITWTMALVHQQAPVITLAINLTLSSLAFAGAWARPPDPKYLLLSTSILFAALVLAD